MGARVALAAAIIAILLAVGAAMKPGWERGVQNSAECQAKPDHWWCQLWDGK